MVGASDPGLVLPGRPHHRVRRRGGARCLRDLRPPAAELTQETDIFDTWFSSGLWPFSTLGWPDDTPDYRRFYPTSVMETGYDILFFWVARMMMLGLFLTDAEPFHTVFLHGIVRAEGGVKMGKTKGNVVDPLEVVEEIGADALRFSLVVGTSPGSDQRLTDAKIQGARNFTNKLWNAARFVIGARPEPLAEPTGEPGLAERWIASRLAGATARATRQLDDLDPSRPTPAACTTSPGATTATGSWRWPSSSCGARTHPMASDRGSGGARRGRWPPP